MSGRTVPDLLLEQYRLGALEGAEAAAVREALAADEGLRERLSTLERSDTEILEAYPPTAFAAAVERRLETLGGPRRGRQERWLLSLVPAAAVGLLMVVGAGALWRGVPPEAGPAPNASGNRLKAGSVGLFLYRKGPELSAEQLAPGALAHPQDVIQVAYQGGGRGYGVIVSVDGRGTLTRHLPATGAAAAPLRGGTVALPAAYRLDDAPLVECFYLVASDHPFEVSVVLAAARVVSRDPQGTDRLPLGAEFAQASFLLRKEDHR